MASARLLKLFGVLAVGLLYASPSEGIEAWRFKGDQVASNDEKSVSLTQAFDKLHLGMSLAQVIDITGEPLSRLPKIRKVVRWQNQDFQVDIILDKEAITSRNSLGKFPDSISALETYGEIVKILGTPNRQTEAQVFFWKDKQECNMTATFVMDQTVEVSYYCPGGKLGMMSGRLGDINF